MILINELEAPRGIWKLVRIKEIKKGKAGKEKP